MAVVVLGLVRGPRFCWAGRLQTASFGLALVVNFCWALRWARKMDLKFGQWALGHLGMDPIEQK